MFRRALPFVALAVLVFFFYRQAAFTTLIFARGDTLLYFYPYWDYRAQTLLAGHLPLWNPDLFMGAPFLANSQAGVFYPLNWPLIFFPAPLAVKISMVAHVLIAAWGTYALARRVFALGREAAILAAAVFALSGYLTAQIEHVNQLQGLAWLPLALLATHWLCTAPAPPARTLLRPTLLLSLSLALQLTAGHTQTAFITLIACAFTALYQLLVSRLMSGQPGSPAVKEASSIKYYVSRILFFTLAITGAFALTAIQILPTLELSRLSQRGGGLPLNEAVSFSLNPLLLGRALLPGYSRLIFSEFVAYIGVIPFILLVLALKSLAPRRGPTGIVNHQSLFSPVTPPGRGNLSSPFFFAALLAGLGLGFALGAYNPLYLLLARFVPGFNLFRAPARWLILWALGAAMLAGYGLQQIGNPKFTMRSRALTLLSLSPLILIGLAFLSATITPAGELGPMGFPAILDLALWLAPLIIFLLLGYIRRRSPNRVWRGISISRAALSLLTLGELLLASQAQPLNHLTTPQAYTSLRPAMTQLLAERSVTCPADCPPPARFLSLSALEFDPGDLRELRSEWDPQLPADAVYDAIIATKHKEVLSPNLPLTWQVPAVDGYDGGILPLRAYAEFAKQFGEVPANTDGRLRQFLKAVPPNALLNLTNTRWIITDKTGDAWVDNVFYDLGLTAAAGASAPLSLTHLPNFQATALGLVLGEHSQTGAAQITFAEGEVVTLPITYDPAQPALRLRWATPATVQRVDLLTPTQLVVRGASLIDERTDTFKSLTLGPYRLAHSGDVKVYENLNVLPRAFIVEHSAISDQPAVMQQHSSAVIIKYEAEHVVVQTTTDTPGDLILTDTNYPGWLASVDQQPASITTAYGLFRAVSIPAGTHTVEFRFDPPSLKLGALISALSALVLLTLLIISLRPPTR